MLEMKLANSFSDELRQARKVTSGTKEWADHNINCLKGCYNDCRYCYAKMMAKRFGRATEETWHIMEIRKEMVGKDFPKLHGRVMFPSSHDIFDFPEIQKACFAVLEKLFASGNEVLITTKPRINVIRQIDKQFSQHKKHLQFRFTITSFEDGLLDFWEPNAPCFQERMDSLIFAFDENYKTSVSMEPFLDNDPSKLIELVKPFTTESIWIGRMNYISRTTTCEEDKPYYEKIRKNYEDNHLWEIYYQQRNAPLVRFKDSILIQLGMEKKMCSRS